MSMERNSLQHVKKKIYFWTRCIINSESFFFGHLYFWFVEGINTFITYTPLYSFIRCIPMMWVYISQRNVHYNFVKRCDALLSPNNKFTFDLKYICKIFPSWDYIMLSVCQSVNLKRSQYFDFHFRKYDWFDNSECLMIQQSTEHLRCSKNL